MNKSQSSKLDEILDKLMPLPANPEVKEQAKADFKVLIEEVIGPDAKINKRSTEEVQYLVRYENNIKAQQRQRKDAL